MSFVIYVVMCVAVVIAYRIGHRHGQHSMTPYLQTAIDALAASNKELEESAALLQRQLTIEEGKQ